MTRKILFALFCPVLALSFSCSSASTPSGNANAGNSSATANTAAAGAANRQLPEGLSSSPLPVQGSTPGIPDSKSANMNGMPRGATPTPGIPDPKELNKPFKPGATPTPGIPDPKTVEQQLKSGGKSQTDSMTAKPPAPAANANRPRANQL